MTNADRDRYIVENSPGEDGKPGVWHERRFAPIQPNEVLCSCGFQFDKARIAAHLKRSNPDFTADPVACLRVMMRREDWPEFCYKIGHRYTTGGDYKKSTGYVPRYTELIEISYITDITGLLANAAVEWIRREYESICGLNR